MLGAKTRENALTEEQRRIYAAEKLVNFRWISKILASQSSYVLTDSDAVAAPLNAELAENGQFAELAYNAVPTLEFIFHNINTLSAPEFPLEGYSAFPGSILVSPFNGLNAGLPGYVAYRPSTKQLVVAIAGTASLQLAYQDLKVLKCRHPSRRGLVHSGFWNLYSGIKASALKIIRQGLAEHDVAELLITGHSMGGSISYLLCMDLLAGNDENISLEGLTLKIVAFGSPRTGNGELVAYWRELIEKHRNIHGPNGILEYSVKAYNDGVPALPPTFFGFQHFCACPLYNAKGITYQVPGTESEHALFTVSPDSTSSTAFPRGGHNYYNGRDFERLIRRISWLERAKPGEIGWEGRYLSFSRK